MKTFEEYLFEASLIKPDHTHLRTLNNIGPQYGKINAKTVQVDPKTNDIYFTSSNNRRYVVHGDTGYVQELYAIKSAA